MRGLVIATLGLGVGLGLAGTGLAQDQRLTDDEIVLRSEGAHRLLLPRDWPVVERGGLRYPAPVEEYLSMKFGQVKSALEGVERELAQTRQRLETLEREQQTLTLRLRMAEERLQRLEGSYGDTAQARPGEHEGRVGAR